MNEKIGRNSPCPCGSRNKLKHCHVSWPPPTRDPFGTDAPAFEVTPQRTPEVINTFRIRKGDKWKTVKGNIAAQLITVPIGSTDPEVEELIGGISKKVHSRLAPESRPKLAHLLRNVRHKLYAVKYHHEKYEAAENEKLRKFETDFGPPGGISIHEREPRLIYEMEAFLFQVRSSLEMLEGFLAAGLGLSSQGFGDHGDKLVKRLENNVPEYLRSIAADIVQMIAAAQPSWLDELIRGRDHIAHLSELEDFSCFIQEPYAGGGKTTIHYPTMPNGQRARDYLQRTKRELHAFSKQFLELAVEGSGLRENADT